MELFPNFDEIIKIISKTKICDSLILFGSALNSENPSDFDIMLYREKSPYKPIDFLAIIELLHKIESQFENVGLSFASGKPRRKDASYYCDIAPLDIGDLDDLDIFFYGIKLNKNYKILNDKDPFEKLNKPNQSKFKKYFIDEYNYAIKNNAYYECIVC